jgi:formylglycine-generating enzyme required for sulfatase activity
MKTCGAVPVSDGGDTIDGTIDGANSSLAEGGDSSHGSTGPDSNVGDGAGSDAAVVTPSCAGADAGTGSCGATNESCCASSLVQGGSFFRSYDGVSFTGKTDPATLNSFRLDKYEVTVGRFRPFVAAVVGGWTPSQGAGKHTHLNGGSGVVDSYAMDAGAYETGWDPAWNTNLATTTGGWYTALHACSSAITGTSTWTSLPGANDSLPIECVSWYEAYAFCIWDGGFLPTEGEWNFAAAGGSEQRAYPWSSPPTSTAIDCSYANYGPSNYCTGPSGAANAVGSESPQGDGKWGQADMAGNVSEWTLDYSGYYLSPCVDCALLTPRNPTPNPTTAYSVARGGGYDLIASAQLASYRAGAPTGGVPRNGRQGLVGVRCARSP